MGGPDLPTVWGGVPGTDTRKGNCEKAGQTVPAPKPAAVRPKKMHVDGVECRGQTHAKVIVKKLDKLSRLPRPQR